MVKTINIGEKVYSLKYGFNALRIFTEATGTDMSVFETLGKSISLNHALHLIWAGLKDGARANKEEFTLTIDDVADLMDEHPNLLTECMEVFVASFVKPGAEKK